MPPDERDDKESTTGDAAAFPHDWDREDEEKPVYTPHPIERITDASYDYSGQDLKAMGIDVNDSRYRWTGSHWERQSKHQQAGYFPLRDFYTNDKPYAEAEPHPGLSLPPAPSIPRRVGVDVSRGVPVGERGSQQTRRDLLASKLLDAVSELARDIYGPTDPADLLADLYVLFAQACAEMERRGFEGYRSMPAFKEATAWMHRHYEERMQVQLLTGMPEGTANAWQIQGTTSRPFWKAGDTVRLNDTGVAIYNTPPIRRRVLMQIARERTKQEHKWGGAEHDAKHTHHDWTAIIVREMASAVFTDAGEPEFRMAMLKVAAVAAAAVEAADRRDPEVREVLAELERKQVEGNE